MNQGEGTMNNVKSGCSKCQLIPPKFSTIRVNTLVTDVSSFICKLQTFLEKECIRKNSDMPRLYQHPILSDVVVVESHGRKGVEPAVKEVIVDIPCGNAVLRGAKVYVPGILSYDPSIQEGDRVSVYCDTLKKCLKGSTELFTGKKHFLGNGIAAISRHQIFKQNITKGVAVDICESTVNLPSLGDFLTSYGFLQNIPSILCCHILGPEPGDIILDMCAAPGGKATHIASLMCNKGMVIAVDRSRRKVEEISRNAEKLKIINLHGFVGDSTKAISTSAEFMGKPHGPPFLPESFDKILLDPPCSALGQRPELGGPCHTEHLHTYPGLQRKLFAQAEGLLRPGGTLVYSTCTITLPENEGLVNWALHEFSSLRLVPALPKLGGSGSQDSKLSTEDREKVQRFSPCICDLLDHSSCDNDTIGFFIAKFEKCLH